MLDTLFDFQREDVMKLVDRKGRLIANDPGTGKTYEAIALDKLCREHNPESKYTLVLAPKTVLGVWEQHFNDLCPELTTVVIDPKKRGEFLKTPGHVFILHYDVLRSMPELQKIPWLHIIADECHRVKNRKAQMTQALKKIKNVQYKTAMSGTPIVNRPDEGWSVLNWLYPDQFRGFWKFYEQYTKYEIVYPQGYHKVVGTQNMDQLHSQIGPYFVSHRKEDILPDLPEKYYSTIWVELTPSQRKMYNQMKKDLLAWIGEHEDTPLVAPVVIAQLIRLQQFACASAAIDDETGKVILTDPSSKLDALMEILEDRGDEQIVIFTQSKQLVKLAVQRLEKDGISHVTLTGDVSADDRTANIETFQRGGARVFIGTIQAGGVGITLTAASTVVFLDRTWSPAMNSQAEDRCHRIGQKNAVEVIDIMAKDTVDLGRRQMLEQKWQWIKEFLGDK